MLNLFRNRSSSGDAMVWLMMKPPAFLSMVMIAGIGLFATAVQAQQAKTMAEAKAAPYPPLAENVERRARYNIAKDIAFDAIRAAQDVKVPMLIIDAGKEELMDITKNGGQVAEILRSKGSKVKYHVIPDMDHYGVYGAKFQ